MPLKLKGCPKCGGDLHAVQEPGDREVDWVCIQCGKRAYSTPAAKYVERPKGGRGAYHTYGRVRA